MKEQRSVKGPAAVSLSQAERAAAADPPDGDAEAFRAMFEASGIAMAQADLLTRCFLHVNAAFCALTGYEREELLALTVDDLTHPDDRARDREAYGRLARGERTDYRSEKRYVRKGGRTVWVQATVSLIRDAYGRPLRSSAAVQDITERRRAEERLHEREAALATELSDARALQAVSTALIEAGDTEALYEQILEAARSLLRAQCASVQILDPETGRLQLLAWRGFTPEAAEFWRCVDVASHGSCGEALRRGERVIVEDTEACEFMAGSQDLQHFRLCGIRAVQSTPLRSRGGQPLGMISTHWRTKQRPSERELRLLDVIARQTADLLERARAERELRYRSEQLETLLDRAPFGIYLVDADFHMIQVNPVAMRTFAGIPGGVLGRDFEAVLRIAWPSARVDEVLRICRHTLETGESYERPESAEQRADRGLTEYYSWRIDRITLPDGRYGLVCYFSDISEPVKAREALRSSEARLGGLVQSAMDAVIAIDDAQRIVLFNPAAERMFRCKAREVLGAPLDRLIPERLRAAHRMRVERFGRTGATARQMGSLGELRGLRGSGEEFPIEASISRVVVGGQQLSTVILRDITERKRAEEHRELLLRELSHRVKNTLAIVQSIASQTLRRARTLDEFRSSFGGRLEALAAAHDLLLREGGWGADVALRELLEHTIAGVAQPERVELEGEPVTVSALAAVSLGMAFHELATNASKYGSLSRPRGRVRVRWSRAEHEPELLLEWRESGGPVPSAPATEVRGFGSRLIQQVARELGASLEREWSAGGLVCHFTLPLGAHVALGARKSAL